MTNDLSPDRLAELRASIDNIDAALVHLLAERFKITQAVGRFKAEIGLPPSDPVREREQIERLRALAAESGLDPAFTEQFLRFIVDEVIRHHRRISAGDTSTELTESTDSHGPSGRRSPPGAATR